MLVAERFLERIHHRSSEIERQFAFLKRFFSPRTIFLHYGAHDCALALRAASYVERVYAVDVSEGVTDGVRLPFNLKFVASRDLWTVGEGAVDVSFGERISATHLAELHKCLARHGVHVFPSCEGSQDLLRKTGFSQIRSHWLANLLHQPKLVTAHK